MTERMSSDSKDHRVTIMMSARELAAVDEWRYQNRIASRGEAIRKLIRKGFSEDWREGRQDRKDSETDDP